MKKIERVAQYAIPTLGLILISGTVAFAAAPVDENGQKQFRFDRPELTQEQKDVLEQAKELREQGDTDGARALLEASDLKVRPQLTDEQKAILEQAKALKDTGDHDGAKALLEANDVRPPHMKGAREKHGAEVRAAVEAGDYQAFLAATENAPFADQVTEDFFETLEEAHDLREAGDHDGAKALMESLGLTPPERHR